jgi:hypothetical protein
LSIHAERFRAEVEIGRQNTLRGGHSTRRYTFEQILDQKAAPFSSKAT